MSTHENSRASFHAGTAEFSEREQEVIGALRRIGHGTDKQVAKELGYPHKSAVQPRISELLKHGVLQEYGNARDPDTGKTVRVVCLTPPREEQLEIAV